MVVCGVDGEYGIDSRSDATVRFLASFAVFVGVEGPKDVVFTKFWETAVGRALKKRCA
jgi:hypothetical protein